MGAFFSGEALGGMHDIAGLAQGTNKAVKEPRLERRNTLGKILI